jgi:Putative 2OG-Fe(II) oxygenase
MDGIETSAQAKAKIGAKSRALKKYEAAPVAYATEQGNPRLDLFSPFGPMIVRAEVPLALVDRINRYADGAVPRGTSTEFLIPKEVALADAENSLIRQTESLIRRYLPLVDETEASQIRIDVFWIVSQYAGTPSPVHFHSCDISGVLYLKVPEIDREDEEEQKTYISNRQAGYINFLIGGKQRFSKSLVSFKPRVGDFYVFPGWLLHGAEPFRGTGERRSLAFNAYVDGSAG